MRNDAWKQQADGMPATGCPALSGRTGRDVMLACAADKGGGDGVGR